MAQYRTIGWRRLRKAERADWDTAATDRSTAGEGAGSAALALLREGAPIALLTGMLYLTVAAYLFGYQDKFGFTYLSLGLEDLIVSSRVILVQLAVGTACLTLFWIVARIFPWFRLTLLETILLLLPLLVGIYAVVSVRTLDSIVFDPDSYWVFGLFCAISIFNLLCSLPLRLFGRFADRLWAIHVAQGIIGALVLVLAAYNLGAADAVTQEEYSFCPRFENKDWVNVQMTGDMLVCAEADVAKKLVFRRFIYAKIGDAEVDKAEKGVVLDKRAFKPLCIGFPANTPDWEKEYRQGCK